MTTFAEKLCLAAIAAKESAELSESEVEKMMKTVEEKASAQAGIDVCLSLPWLGSSHDALGSS